YDVDSASPASRLYAAIGLTAVAMGLRNATVRRLAVADLTTTVLTITLTALAADSAFAGGSNPRLGRRVASVLSMFGGAAIRLLLLRWGIALPLVASGAGVLVATAYAVRSIPAVESAPDHMALPLLPPPQDTGPSS